VIATLGVVGLAAGDSMPVPRIASYSQDRHSAQKLLQAQAAAQDWHQRYLELHRVLVHRASVREAIGLACDTYGYCSTLWRKASCETGGSFNPNSSNSSGASGLFQFMRGTWQSTPYANQSIWSPYASALAAGWMHAHGRGGEWACQ
jgi:hypothetical protein